MEDLRTSVSNIINDHETVMNILYDYWDPEYLTAPIESDVYKKFTEYVTSLIKANPKWKEFYGNEFIREENFEKIEEKSDIIVRVRTVKKMESSKDFNNDEYKCRVLETVKGSINEKEIEIRFLYNTVKTGGEYIVCLDSDKLGDMYFLSAKNAVKAVKKDVSFIPIVIISLTVILSVVIISLIIILIKKRHMAKSS